MFVMRFFTYSYKVINITKLLFFENVLFILLIFDFDELIIYFSFIPLACHFQEVYIPYMTPSSTN